MMIVASDLQRHWGIVNATSPSAEVGVAAVHSGVGCGSGRLRATEPPAHEAWAAIGVDRHAARQEELDAAREPDARWPAAREIEP